MIAQTVLTVVAGLLCALAGFFSYRSYIDQRRSYESYVAVRGLLASLRETMVGPGSPAPPVPDVTSTMMQGRTEGSAVASAMLENAPAIFADHRARQASGMVPPATGPTPISRACLTHGAVMVDSNDPQLRCPQCDQPTFSDAPPPHLRN